MKSELAPAPRVEDAGPRTAPAAQKLTRRVAMNMLVKTSTVVATASLAPSMSRASPRNELALAKMRKRLSELEGLRDKNDAARKHHSNAEAEYFAGKPKAPDYERDMPPEIKGQFENLTVGQLAVLPHDHPYAAWSHTRLTSWAVETAEYDAVCKKLKVDCGLDAAESAYNKSLNDMWTVANKILEIEATGIEAIALKLRAMRLLEVDFESDDLVENLLACVDATAKQAGFATA
jgi:hypothetical protein